MPAGRLGVEDRRERDWRKPFKLPLLGNTIADEELTALVRFNPQREDWRRPFPVYLIGPSVGDEVTFDAEHADDDWMALGTVEFLRAWVGHPAFRLVK
ncbi:DUF6368 family protein [Streptomyces massasporeus]